MGFEQLATLKAKLIGQAKNEPQVMAPRSSEPAPFAKDAKSGKGKRRSATQARSTKAAQLTTPVAPVVHTFGKLQKRFPFAFPKNPAPKVPLKIGIFEDMLTHAVELGATEAEMRDAIRAWCRSARYLACLTKGALRINLAGQPVGTVTEADAHRSKRLLFGRPRRGPVNAKAATQTITTEPTGGDAPIEPPPGSATSA